MNFFLLLELFGFFRTYFYMPNIRMQQYIIPIASTNRH